MNDSIEKILREVSADVVSFAQEVVRTRSMTCQEQDVAHLVEEKMRALGYDEVKTDGIGNVIGRSGSGGGIALLFWCVYFIPIGVLAYLHFSREMKMTE